VLLPGHKMKNLLCSCLVATLVGCTTVSTEDVVFRNAIPPTIHHVYFGEMLARCYKYTPLWIKLLGGIPFACAEWDLNKNTCDIYISENAPDWMLKHELEHCNGFGHK
jgi:hypothetical protein